MRGEPAGVALPLLQQVMTCGPARGSQGDTVSVLSSSVIFTVTACHLPVLGVAVPGGGERGHCAGEGDT